MKALPVISSPKGSKRDSGGLGLLYRDALPSTRTGPIFSAFPYPTKISAEAVAIFVAAHTNPGDVVFDGFAGSGTTGIAALLCESPTPSMIEQARRLRLKVRWGARRAVLYEIGALGSFVADTLCNPPDPKRFEHEANSLLEAAEAEIGWVYHAVDETGTPGSIRYVVWSDLVSCPSCKTSQSVWSGSVRRNPARVLTSFSCPACKHNTPLNELTRKTKSVRDRLLANRIRTKERVPVWVYGVSNGREWTRAADADDLRVLAKCLEEPTPNSVPVTRIPWGDLYRSGYHQGISHLHHFYTARNLLVFGTLWRLTDQSPLREALRFWLLSYNASHATIMTRVVAKQHQRDLVVTSSQPGVLYVSGLPVEKNIIFGLKRKLTTIQKAFTMTHRSSKLVEVVQGSCHSTCLRSKSIDYAFTDPPFGGNIPYSEINFINEAWLGRRTDNASEITISPSQRKALVDYGALLSGAFLELRRVLRDDAKATVVFHSASAQVWNVLRQAYISAGFQVSLATILDKKQGSFKQVTTDGAVAGDPVLLLTKQPVTPISSLAKTVRELLTEASDASDPVEKTPQRLYSRFVADCLKKHIQVPLSAEKFYELVALESQDKCLT